MVPRDGQRPCLTLLTLRAIRSVPRIEAKGVRKPLRNALVAPERALASP